MKSRLSIIIIAILLAVSAYFVMKHVQAKKQEKASDTAGIAPKEPESRLANPEGVSPFDKPNVDPVASEFKAQPSIDTMPVTILKFEKTLFDFGKVTEGDIVKTQFKFTNAGNVVLLISHAQASCGCTVPTTPKDPIKPGESGVIDVQFNSVGKKGETTKTVTIQANTKPIETVLVIKASVIPRNR